MAIDSAEKRLSAAGIYYFPAAGVTPNAAEDQEWRQESGWGYAGILSSGAVGPASVSGLFGWWWLAGPGRK